MKRAFKEYRIASIFNIVEQIVIFMFFTFCAVLIIGCAQKTEIIEAKIIERNEDNNIILRQGKNNDKSIKNKLKLTLKDIQNVQEYINNNFPSYNHTGDISERGIKKVMDDFNNNPSYCLLYLNGLENMAGYSSVYSHLIIEDNILYSYYFSIDEEYSDRSGIEYFNENIFAKDKFRFVFRGSTDKSLKLIKNNYWEIFWNDNFSEYERQIILENYLLDFFTTKVSKNIDISWLKSIHTGIEEYQTIEDTTAFQFSVNGLIPIILFPIKDKAMLDRIVLRINQEGVEFYITKIGIVLVADEVTARHMRVMLIIEDLIPSEIKPWNIFNKAPWTSTDFERNISFRRTQIEMITDHIKAIEGINDAYVIVKWPETTLFRADQKPITANVIISPKPKSDIFNDRKKIQGIQKILKFAIKGLDNENIVIATRYGSILNDFDQESWELPPRPDPDDQRSHQSH